MSGKKQRKKAPNSKSTEDHKRDSRESFIDDTAAEFSCSHGVAEDFLHQCERALADLAMNIRLNQAAHEIWAGRPARGSLVAGVLGAFLEERQRNLGALKALRERLEALVRDNVHEHIDPIEPCREIVLARLYPESESDV